MVCYFFFFKQKTAYEMRISDWSSDVCSSDLAPVPDDRVEGHAGMEPVLVDVRQEVAANASATTSKPSSSSASGIDSGGRKRNTLPQEIGRASCRERVCQYV